MSNRLFIFQNHVAKQDENDFKVEHKLSSGPFDYFSRKYMFMIRNETFEWIIEWVGWHSCLGQIKKMTAYLRSVN